MRFLQDFGACIEVLNIFVTKIKKLKNKNGTKWKETKYSYCYSLLERARYNYSNIKLFLELTNDLDNVKLLVVTTQKEEFEKENNLHLKDQFIKDVKSNMELQKLITKYNKILSTNEIKEILKCSKLENIEEIINNKIQKFQTTNTLIEEFIIQNHLKERIYHFHYPDTKGIMADQLNYVLNNFEFKDEKNYYFSVYNADSIPNKIQLKKF